MKTCLLYGARLTKYTSNLQLLCHKFTGLGSTAARLPPIKAGHFHELDKAGRFLARTRRTAHPLGAQRSPELDPKGREDHILSFPIECEAIVPATDLIEIVNAHLKAERSFVDNMLHELGIDTDPPLVEFAKRGVTRIRNLLITDIWQKGKTSILPPSASMPDALFEPERVFEPFDP